MFGGHHSTHYCIMEVSEGDSLQDAQACPRGRERAGCHIVGGDLQLLGSPDLF